VLGRSGIGWRAGRSSASEQVLSLTVQFVSFGRGSVAA
jgi:hypothetical protein